MTRLGKGLEALIHTGPEAVDQTTGITTVRVEHIHPNKYQPRKVFDQEKIQDLANSLSENGMIQPIIVTKRDHSHYELIAGERRLEAAKLANFSEVPVIIRSVSKQEQLQFAIIENIQRENLNAMEEAQAYQQLIDEFGMTHAKISEIMGKDRATITNTLRLLKLTSRVQQMILNNKISSGHARAILQLDKESQTKFAYHIFDKQLSVRQAEKEARKLKNKELERLYDAEPKSLDLDFSDFEKQLSKSLKMKVKISDKNDKGKITLYYSNPDERQSLINFLKK